MEIVFSGLLGYGYSWAMVPSEKGYQMQIIGVANDHIDGFLNWLAAITLSGYYAQLNPEDPDQWTEDERESLVGSTKAAFDGQETTWEEIGAFMFDNRRT